MFRVGVSHFPKISRVYSLKSRLCEGEYISQGDFFSTPSAENRRTRSWGLKKAAGACKLHRAVLTHWKKVMAELQELCLMNPFSTPLSCPSTCLQVLILAHTVVSNATINWVPTLLWFFVMLQVVETNLVAFDCHWILINEVSPTIMINASCCFLVCLYLDFDNLFVLQH